MPRQTFKLGANDPRQVLVEWKGMWKNMQVSLDGQPLGTIPDAKALKAGQVFSLPDGSALGVTLKTGLQPALLLTHNGTPLPGSGGDPNTQLAQARGVAWFIGGFTLIAGVVAELVPVPFLLQLGIGWGAAIVGVVFLVLGHFIGKRSAIALGLAMALLLVDTVFTVVAASDTGHVPTGALVMRVFFLIAMSQGFKAIKQLKAADPPTT